MKKVKRITVFKSFGLCKKCKYLSSNSGCKGKACDDCELKGETRCKCLGIRNGEPCPYFERETEGGQ